MSWAPTHGTFLSRDDHHTSVRERIASAFRRALAASRSPAKELARDIGRTPKGAELILRGEVSPNLEAIVQACRQYDEVWNEFRELCGRADDISQAEAVLAEMTERLRQRRSVAR